MCLINYAHEQSHTSINTIKTHTNTYTFNFIIRMHLAADVLCISELCLRLWWSTHTALTINCYRNDAIWVLNMKYSSIVYVYGNHCYAYLRRFLFIFEYDRKITFLIWTWWVFAKAVPILNEFTNMSLNISLILVKQ